MCRLLFRGIKTFWKTKSYLDLAIIEHVEHGIFEVIAFDPALRKHAPRLHINIKVVHDVLNHCGFNKEGIEEGFTAAVTTFLFNHIFIAEYRPTSKIINVDVQAIFHAERSANNCVFIVDRPISLPFFASPYSDSGEDASIYQLGCVQHLEIPLRDKWRLPLILVRVSKSLPLQESDAKIWACFVHNKTHEELMESIVAALAVCVPSESKQVLRSAAHAALLPQDCPFPGDTRPGSHTAFSLLERSTCIRSVCEAGSRAPPRSPCCSAATTTTTDTAAIIAENLSKQQRSPVNQDLPPLSPRTGQTAGGSPVGNQQCNTEPVAATLSLEEAAILCGGDQQERGHRRLHSLGSLWPVRLTRAALSSVSASLSAPSSPQHSSHTVVPITGASDFVEEDVVFTELEKSFGAVRNARSRRLAVNESSSRLNMELLPEAGTIKRDSALDGLLNQQMQRGSCGRVTPTAAVDVGEEA